MVSDDSFVTSPLIHLYLELTDGQRVGREIDVDTPLMFGSHLAEKSLWEKGLGRVPTHLYQHDEH